MRRSCFERVLTHGREMFRRLVPVTSVTPSFIWSYLSSNYRRMALHAILTTCLWQLTSCMAVLLASESFKSFERLNFEGVLFFSQGQRQIQIIKGPRVSLGSERPVLNC